VVIVRDDFAFDRVVIALAFGVLSVLLSNAFGGFIYRTERIVEVPGYKIEVTDSSAVDSKPKGLPDVILIGKIMASASLEAGKKVFNKCAVCHNPDKDGGNKVGPNLWGIVGAKVARHDDFKYSDAMKSRGASGKTCLYEELYRYIYSPKSYIPGNKMAFAGIKDDAERANLIAYLRSLSDSMAPLPKVEKE